MPFPPPNALAATPNERALRLRRADATDATEIARLHIALTSAWEIYGLHVQPTLRGGGIGSALFEEARETARRVGSSRLTLWVVATNAPARRFYESKRMQPDGAEKTASWIVASSYSVALA